MAVRIQEIFGLRQTPRVAGGRVPVVMHLLAPNMRPQQITTDLESFWRTHLRRSPQRPSPPLPETRLARRPAHGGAGAAAENAIARIAIEDEVVYRLISPALSTNRHTQLRSWAAPCAAIAHRRASPECPGETRLQDLKIGRLTSALCR